MRGVSVDGHRKAAARARGAEASPVRPDLGFRGGVLGVRHQADVRLLTRQVSDIVSAAENDPFCEIIPTFYDFRALMRSPTSR